MADEQNNLQDENVEQTHTETVETRETTTAPVSEEKSKATNWILGIVVLVILLIILFAMGVF